jgi:ABC-type nitrate/sulfonate/bicarbonate transport system ATPase subunit
MISLEAITFSYPSSQLLFESYSWQVERGQSWAVLGPSGCGKTTLLYLLAGLQFPSAGQLQVDGAALTRPRPQTGLILQDYGLLPWATVRENISLGLRVRRFYGPDGLHAPAGQIAKGDTDGWLNRLGLTGQASKYPAQVSGGQRQRTAIARTLVLQPDLLLMDEPFSALDAPTRLGLEDLTLELWQEQRFTFVIVTHAIEEAAYLGQSILILGSPPHRRARIFANPVFGQPSARESEAYLRLCRALRDELEAA